MNSSDSTLPVSIVFYPREALEQMRTFTRTAEDIFAKSEASKVAQSSSTVTKTKQINGEYQDWWKRALTEQNSFEKMLRQAQIEDSKRADVEFKASMQGRIAARNAEIASAQSARKVIDSMFASGEMGAKDYNYWVRENVKQTNLLTSGDVRARGEFHRFLAKAASLTFELTGAFYGLTAAVGIFGAPAIVGVKFLKGIEDARLGITGILTSMTDVGDKNLKGAEKVTQAWQLSAAYVSQVQKDALKYGIDMSKLTEVNRAVMAPGLSTGLSLSQIQKLSTEGAASVSMLGLNSTQYVQEVRDLIQGGIQPASSTLATSLGITDKLLKEWKKQGPEVLFKNLHERMQGMAETAEQLRKTTLSGSWDIFVQKLAMSFGDPQIFGNLISTINSMSAALSSSEFKSAVDGYFGMLKMIGSTMYDIAIAVDKYKTEILAVVGAMLAWKTVQAALGMGLVVEVLWKQSSALFSIATGAKAAAVARRELNAASVEGSMSTGAASVAGTMSTGAAIKGLVGRAGLIGFALWGVYEIADYFGIIDNLFKSAEDRAALAKDRMKGKTDNAIDDELKKAARDVTALQGAKEKLQGSIWKGTHVGDIAGQNKRYDAQIAEAKKAYDVIWEEWNSRQEQRQKWEDTLNGVKGTQLSTPETKKPKGLKENHTEYTSWVKKLENERDTYLGIATAQEKLTASEKDRIELLGALARSTDKVFIAHANDLLLQADQNIALQKQSIAIEDRNKQWEKSIDHLKSLRTETEKYNAAHGKNPVETDQQKLDSYLAQLQTYKQQVAFLQADTKPKNLGLGGGLINANFDPNADYGGSVIAAKVSAATPLPTMSNAEKDKAIAHYSKAIVELEKLIPGIIIKMGIDENDVWEKFRNKLADSITSGLMEGFNKGGNVANAFAKTLESALVSVVSDKVNKSVVSMLEGINTKTKTGGGTNDTVGTAPAGGSWWALAAVVAVGVIQGLGKREQGLTAAQVQATQGTGTVLGDIYAKSESIAKSSALMSSFTFDTTTYTRDMRAYLTSIDKNIAHMVGQGAKDLTGLGSMDGRTDTYSEIQQQIRAISAATVVGAAIGAVVAGYFSIGVGTGAGAAIGAGIGAIVGTAMSKTPIIGKLADSFWGATNRDTTATGVGVTGTISQLQKGQGGYQYAAGTDSTRALFGMYTNESAWKEIRASKGVAEAFANVFKDMGDMIKSSAVTLGADGKLLDSMLSKFVVNTGDINLQGMTVAQKTQALQAIISKQGDLMVEVLVPAMKKFQKGGEELATTLVRIATEVNMLKTFGKIVGTRLFEDKTDKVLQASLDKKATTAYDAVQAALSDKAAAEQALVDARNIELGRIYGKSKNGGVFEDKLAERDAKYNKDHAITAAQNAIVASTDKYNKSLELLKIAQEAAGAQMAISATQADKFTTALGGQDQAAQKMSSFIQTFADDPTKKKMYADTLTTLGLPLLKTTKEWFAFSKTATEEQYKAILNNQSTITSWVDLMAKAAQGITLMTDALRGLVKEDLFRTLTDFKHAQSQVSTGRYYGSVGRSIPVQLPSFAIGSEYIPYDMTANIHKGEMVVDAQAAAAMRRYGVSPAANDSGVKEELRAFREEMKSALIPIAQNTGISARLANRWEGGGMPETRTVAA